LGEYFQSNFSFCLTTDIEILKIEYVGKSAGVDGIFGDCNEFEERELVVSPRGFSPVEFEPGACREVHGFKRDSQKVGSLGRVT
jgi:hypothetical protein